MSEVPYVAWEGQFTDNGDRHRVVVTKDGATIEVAEKRDAMGKHLWHKLELQPYSGHLTVACVLRAMAERRSTWDRVGGLIEAIGSSGGGPLNQLYKPVLRLTWYEHDGSTYADLLDCKGRDGEPVFSSGEHFRETAAESLLAALEELRRKWEAS